MTDQQAATSAVTGEQSQQLAMAAIMSEFIARQQAVRVAERAEQDAEWAERKKRWAEKDARQQAERVAEQAERVAERAERVAERAERDARWAEQDARQAVVHGLRQCMGSEFASGCLCLEEGRRW